MRSASSGLGRADKRRIVGVGRLGLVCRRVAVLVPTCSQSTLAAARVLTRLSSRPWRGAHPWATLARPKRAEFELSPVGVRAPRGDPHGPAAAAPPLDRET